MSEREHTSVQAAAVEILDARCVLAIATVRPDGWPQNTIVGYSNDGMTIYFMILRASQKFHNISEDNRVAMAIGEQPSDIQFAEAVYAAGHAAEVTDTQEREWAWQLLMKRHPNLAGKAMPAEAMIAMMRAQCEHVSVLEYSKGLGHTELLELPQK